MTNPQKLFQQTVILFSAVLTLSSSAFAQHDYGEALHYATKFFGAQRCGTNDSWIHGKCHSGDQNINGTDLLGGWHDCGDHVKFGSTNGFAAAIMLHAYINFGNAYPDDYTPTNSNFNTNTPNGIPDVLDEVKYYTDYLMKTISGNRMYFQIGNAYTDHLSCSEPVYQTNSEPNMGGVRESHWVDGGGASNLAGINAAVLAMMSIAYKPFDDNSSTYTNQCLAKAKEFYNFGHADTDFWSQNSVDGSGNDDGTYEDTTWADDMALGAISLYLATKDDKYINGGNIDGKDLEGFLYFSKTDNFCEWDAYRGWTPPTYSRVQPLAAYSYAKVSGDQDYINGVVYEVAGHPDDNADGGFMAAYNDTYKFAFYDGWGSLKYSSGAAYVAMLAYDLTENNDYKTFAKNNMDFVLGTHPDIANDAPSGFSFLVGIGNNYPSGQIHHSAAADLQSNGSFTDWHSDSYQNPKTLYGAIVGGPTKYNGGYVNDRDRPSWTVPEEVKSNEVCIYYNAPYVALLGGYDQAGGNLPPSTINLSNNVISESAASGAKVGTFTTIDIDEGDTHTYSITAGGSNFSISGSDLVTSGTIAPNDYDITVSSSDGSASVSKNFTIKVTAATVGGNLLHDLGWYVVIDEYGTAVDTGDALVTDDSVHAKFTLAKEIADSVYPWAELATDLPDSGNLGSSGFIKISYKSNNNFTLELPMAAINTDIASQYGKTLPASADWNDLSFELTDQVFVQESWSTGDVPFNKDNIKSIAFSAKYNDASGWITIRSVEVDGYDVPIIGSASLSKNISTKINLKNITSEYMNMSVPSTGNYNIKLYSLNGQLIENINSRLNKGLNKVDWKSTNIGTRMAIVKISGNNKTMSAPVMIK